MRARAWRSAAIVAATSLTLLMAAPPASAAPFFTSVPLMIALADPSTSKATRIISVGDEVGDFFFEGVPDGIGAMPGAGGSVEVFVNHEQTAVPFDGLADFEMASVSHSRWIRAAGSSRGRCRCRTARGSSGSVPRRWPVRPRACLPIST